MDRDRYSTILKSERVQALLGEATGWREADHDKRIAKTYRFPSFRAAIAFVGYVAELAEEFDHHPDIEIHYQKVRLVLTTPRSAGGLTERDFDLAKAIDSAT